MNVLEILKHLVDALADSVRLRPDETLLKATRSRKLIIRFSTVRRRRTLPGCF